VEEVRGDAVAAAERAFGLLAAALPHLDVSADSAVSAVSPDTPARNTE